MSVMSKDRLLFFSTKNMYCGYASVAPFRGVVNNTHKVCFCEEMRFVTDTSVELSLRID